MRPSCLFSFFYDSRSIPCDSESEESSADFLRDYAVREINAILWVSLIAVTFFLLEKVAKVLGLWAKARGVPGPPCPSFYGHSNLISRGNFTDILAALHKQYGPVVKLWLGPAQLLISMKDPLVIKEMLLKAEDKLPLAGRVFRLAFGQLSLFVSSYDKQVHRRRESLMMELDRTLLEREHVFPEKFVESVMGRIQEGSICRKLASQNMAFTIMGAALFGDAFLRWSKATVYEDLFTMISKDACFWASYRILPFWKLEFWRCLYLCRKLTCLTQEIVLQGRTNYKQFCLLDHKHPIELTNIKMDALSKAPSCSGTGILGSLWFQELNGHLNATKEPCGNILGVMFHGCLTTAGLISNMLARIVAHPELQDKIYSEVVMSRKGSKKQNQEDVAKMHLLLATVYESVRLLPAGPLIQRCSLQQDLILKTGITLPSGAALVVPTQLVQKDSSSWGSDASKFNPYRFLLKPAEGSDSAKMTQSTGTSGNLEELFPPRHDSFNLINPNANAAFLSFGSGTRACVGQKFVIHRVATLFASLLEHYEIKLHEESKNRNPTTANCVLQLHLSSDINFVKRNC